VTRLTSCDAWKALGEHAKVIRLLNPRDLEHFRSEHDVNQFKRNVCGITLDYSKQSITQETLSLLFDLARTCDLKEKIDALMRGDHVNTSENRPALHTALRAPDTASLWVNGRDVALDICATRKRMQVISDQVRHGAWVGYSGRPVIDIVNIGIGGSDLGAKFCVDALGHVVLKTLRFHFISDADPDAFKNTVATLNPETTLFIISSKSFMTEETLYNAQQAKAWIGKSAYFKYHFIAITASFEKARAFGIQEILPVWDWVGGRYSSCSAVNLITAIAIGFEGFNKFLAGAHDMDMHFKNTSFECNLPVLSALLGIWNNNFLGAHTLLMLTYAHGLKYLVHYVQQLDMESNGKSLDKENKRVDYVTGPIIWGGGGNRAQHSYYQLLCQGTHEIAVEFVSVRTLQGHLIDTFCKSKQHVLSKGVGLEEEMQNHIRGGVPVMYLQLQQCVPYELGALISFYEHRTYVQSIIWNINAFDQPGVERTKHLSCVS
jgi:glucose-6-phosphate isomerase